MMRRTLQSVNILVKSRARFSTCVVSDNIVTTTTGNLPVTTTLKIVNTAENDKIPVFRMMTPSGKMMEGVQEPPMTEELATKMYKYMVRVQSLDDILYNAQRQGRISFYMQAAGEEAIHIGTASMTQPEDTIFAQYREQGVLLWRGFSLQQAADQCFSNEGDLGKGRQMPVHYGSKALNFQTISSPLATQLPQAVGASYANKVAGVKAVPVCFFGEGAASEGDFHAALNFASTLETPLIFFCRNNGYAISTPVKDQFRGDGIASRAAGYGMHVIRVDGNDLFSLREAMGEARKLALEKSVPVLIEAMTYRQGHHSTSDDSTRYRESSEIKYWQDNFDPVARWRMYMESKGWWTAEQDKTLRESERAAVMQAMETAENKSTPPIDQMFEDVYSQKTQNIIKQEQEITEMIQKYPEHYTAQH